MENKQMRVSSKLPIKGKRIKCPCCNELGYQIKYKDGSRLFIHEANIGYMGFTEVSKHCYVPVPGGN